MIIPRRFAIADQGGDGRAVPAVPEERTPRSGYDVPQSVLRQFSPDPDGPVDRARLVRRGPAYCNWLSEQEGLPKDQWCYEPGRRGRTPRG